MNAPITRRRFIETTLVGGGLLISATLLGKQEGAAGAKSEPDPKAVLTPLAEIHADNRTTFYYPSPEMGQGTDTSLAMMFVEELGGDFSAVEVAPLKYLLERTAEGEYRSGAVPQFSGGSTSISRNYSLLREAAATTREKLIRAAAKQLSVSPSELRAQGSYVLSPNGDKLPFSALLNAAVDITLEDDFTPALSDPATWRIAGKPQAGMQLEKIVTGAPLYGMDIRHPGSKVALMARCPTFDGEVESVDDKAARSIPGVHDVVILPRPPLDSYYTYLAAGVAVIADDFWTAKKARDALKIQWRKHPGSNESGASLKEQAEKSLASGDGQIVREDGDFAAALEASDQVLKRSYHVPLIAHAQMEPQNCFAEVTENSCRVVGPLQSPGGASVIAAAITGFDRAEIDIQYTRLGGGFGRRLTSDHVAEAVTIAKLSGTPVQLIWTREDDLANDFYRPMCVQELTAGLDKDGKLTAWAQRSAGTPKHLRRNGVKKEELFGADLYVDDFPAGFIEHLKILYWPLQTRIPQGSWRAPAHTANAFIVESFFDELAEFTQQDPLQLRLQLLGDARELPYSSHGGPVFDSGRLAGVLKSVAALARWGRELPAGRGLGLAAHFTFGGYCAQIAEVEWRADHDFKIHRVFAAIDVGTVINPEGVRAQVEGSVNDGISAAYAQHLEVSGGQVTSVNFDTYQMTRMDRSATEIIVDVIDSDKAPSGAGEMAIPPTAPAIANGIRAAGGPRLYSMPFKLALERALERA